MLSTRNACLMALALVCGVAVAQPQGPAAAQGRAQARAEITQERAASEKRMLENEKACYQHFAVTDCLKKVRRVYNDEERALRQREIAINGEERDERTAKQRDARGQKQKDHANKLGGKPFDTREPVDADADERKRAHDAEAASRASGPKRSPQAMAAEQQRRSQEAASRASSQQDKISKKQHALQQRSASQDATTDKARATYDARQVEAAHRLQVHDERMKERDAKHKKAAPLPTPQ